METKVLSIRNYKVGYEVRTEEVSMPDNPTVTMKSAYMPDGSYIGTSVWAHRLIVKKNIRPEKSDPSNHVCSIGFCEKNQKWYGWSHRAMCGFGVGDAVKEGDCAAESGWISEYLEKHPEADKSLPVGFTAQNLNDAKLMAIAFADSVG